jgi:hypothetical protein
LLTEKPDALGTGFFIWFYCYPTNILLTQLSTLLWLFKEQRFYYGRILGAALTMSVSFIITFFFQIWLLFWLVPRPWLELIPESLKLFVPAIILVLINCPIDFAIAHLFFKKNITKEKGLFLCLATIISLILPILPLLLW